MVALGIKPSASGLVTHERMTAYIASKGVNELYADSLEALLRAEPANPAEFLADHFAAMTDTVATPAARPQHARTSPAPHHLTMDLLLTTVVTSSRHGGPPPLSHLHPPPLPHASTTTRLHLHLSQARFREVTTVKTKLLPYP